MACFTFCMLHFLIGFILQDLPVPDLWRNGLFYVSTVNHVEVFINGLIDTRQLVYYLSFTALILLLTYNILNSANGKLSMPLKDKDKSNTDDSGGDHQVIGINRKK